MAASYASPTEYIQHHLTFFTRPVKPEGGFWSLNIDTLLTTLVVGALAFGFMWLVARKATTGVPSKTQAFVELAVDFVKCYTTAGQKLFDACRPCFAVSTGHQLRSKGHGHPRSCPNTRRRCQSRSDPFGWPRFVRQSTGSASARDALLSLRAAGQPE